MFVNMTPHEIKEIVTGLTIPPSGEVTRVAVSYERHGTIENVPCFKAIYGEIENLPEEKPNTTYIVSGMVLDAIASNAVTAHRRDFVSPGELVRDEKGQPIGCSGFKVN